MTRKITSPATMIGGTSGAKRSTGCSLRNRRLTALCIFTTGTRLVFIAYAYCSIMVESMLYALQHGNSRACSMVVTVTALPHMTKGQAGRKSSDLEMVPDVRVAVIPIGIR